MFIIASAGGGDKKAPSTATKTTPEKAQTDPKAAQSPKAVQRPKETTTATTSTNEALSVFVALQDNEVCHYNIENKTQEFLKNNPTLFPATSVDAVKPLTNTAIEFKHLNKNISNYGDK